MKPFALFQPLSKFDMFTFVVSYAIIVFFLAGGRNKIFGFLVRKQNGGSFQRKDGRTTLE